MSINSADNLNVKSFSNVVRVPKNVPFTSFLLKKDLCEGLHNAAFKYTSPIQLQTLPIGLFGRDLIIQSKAGTGKTLVFAIIALEIVRTEVKTPQVLVLAPTREVAVQNCNVIKSIGSKLGVVCRPFIGGLSVSDDKENAEMCQIVVGTPGRILHLVDAGYINTQYIRLFVLDEADELMEERFKEVVDVIFQKLPIEKQVIATSATYPEDLYAYSRTYFRNPKYTKLSIIDPSAFGIVHYSYLVKCSSIAHLEYKCKLNALHHILNRVQFTQCLIFCNRIDRVETLCEDIKCWGFSTTSISSAKEQLIRLKTLENLLKFKCKILVSSNLSSRGISANYVDLVINFDAPQEYATYMNRVDRAGRFGNRGVAITILTTRRQEQNFSTFQKTAKFKSYSLTEPVPKDLLYKIPTTAQANNIHYVQEAHGTIKEQKNMHVDVVSALDETTSNCQSSSSNRFQLSKNQELICKENKKGQTIIRQEDKNVSNNQLSNLVVNAEKSNNGFLGNLLDDFEDCKQNLTGLTVKLEKDEKDNIVDMKMENCGCNVFGPESVTKDNDMSMEAHYPNQYDLKVITDVSEVKMESEIPELTTIDLSKREKIDIVNDEKFDSSFCISPGLNEVKKNSKCSSEVPKDIKLPIQEFVLGYEANVDDFDSANKNSDKFVSMIDLEIPSRLQISPKELIDIKVSQELFNQATKENQNIIYEGTENQPSLNIGLSSELRHIGAAPVTLKANSDCLSQTINSLIHSDSEIVEASTPKTNVSVAEKEFKSFDILYPLDADISSYDHIARKPLLAYKTLRIADIKNDKRRQMSIFKIESDLTFEHRTDKNSVKLQFSDKFNAHSKTTTNTNKKKEGNIKNRENLKFANVMQGIEAEFVTDTSSKNKMHTKIKQFQHNSKQCTEIQECLEEKTKYHSSKSGNKKHRVEIKDCNYYILQHHTKKRELERQDTQNIDFHSKILKNKPSKILTSHKTTSGRVNEVDVSREVLRSHSQRQDNNVYISAFKDSKLFNSKYQAQSCRKCSKYAVTSKYIHRNAASGSNFANF